MVALLCAVLLIRDARDSQTPRLGAAFALASACAMLIHSAEGLVPPASVRAALLPISSSWIVLLWLAARSLFDDEFHLKMADGIVVAAWVLLGAFNYAELAASEPISLFWADATREALSYALVVHITYVAISGADADLVERRRRSRVVFALCLLSIYLLNKIGEAVFGYSALPLWFTTLLYGLMTGFFVACLLALVRIDSLGLGFHDSISAKSHAPLVISNSDKKLIRRLTQVIEDERAYREPDLSIAALAARVGAREHDLRALINRTMGFRNFRTFLNGYRIEEAVSLVCDPTKQDISILGIAMDSGFGSLASFNRAFKQETGISPSTMRKAALSNKMTKLE